MNCKSFQIYIEETLEPNRPDGEAAAHISACGECQSLLARRVGLQDLLRGLDVVGAPGDFDFGLRSKLRTEASRAGWYSLVPSIRRLGSPVQAAVVCATVIIAGLAFVLFRPTVGPDGAVAVMRAKSITGEGGSKVAGILTAANSALALASVDQPESESKTTPRMNDVGAPSVVGFDARGASRTAPRRQRDESVKTADYALSEARVFSSQGTPLETTVDQPIRLRIPERQLNLLIGDDERGFRSIPLRSVTFGSQSMLDRPTTKVSTASGTEGIW